MLLCTHTSSKAVILLQILMVSPGTHLLRFPGNDETEEVNKLFIVWPFHCDHLKATIGQQITLKRHVTPQRVVHLSHDTDRWHWSVETLFDSCQLTITLMSIRMSSIILNTDCICLGHLPGNAWSLEENNARSSQENTQSECVYYCNHIINRNNINLPCYSKI